MSSSSNVVHRRVAVVTGSNKGIGFGIVKELLLGRKFDGDVYITSRDETRGKEAVAELKKLGLDPKFHQLDIDDESSVIRLRDYLKATYGGLDVLVNNAAIAFKNAATEPFALQATVTLRTNYFNTHRACNILFPILKPHARVVNISSYAGHLGTVIKDDTLKAKLASPDLTYDQLTALMQQFVDSAQTGEHEKYGWPNSTYRTSKVGLSALTRIQQRHFDQDPARRDDDIIVNHLNPGYVDTDMTSHKGAMTIAQAADAPCWLALLPPNADGPKGQYIWHNRQIVDWVNGPLPSAY